MQFGVLGPLEVSEAGNRLNLGGRRQRTVLAHLVLRANRTISSDELIEAVWRDRPPDEPRAAVYTYISNLRKAIGAGRIESRAGGYLLRLGRDELDSARFEVLAKEGSRALAADPERAAAAIADGLQLWRGRPFADLTDDPALEMEATRLEDMRLAALEDRADAALALGRHQELVTELETQVRANPLRERLWAQLMLALYRSGRQAEAFAAYLRARDVLSEELGVDPTPDLRRLHERMVKQDPGLELKGRPLRSYQLMAKIGEGAFGTVFRAMQPEVGREIAIKQVHPKFAENPDFVRRFEQEAQLIARLEHPHVVPLYDYWRDPGGTYLAMRYMRGGNLAERLNVRGALPTAQAVGILEQIASALDAAHRQGIVHRDLRPPNILFDDDGNAYLSDFGIAKDLALLDPTFTDLVAAYYEAPEETSGGPVGPASDVYSLGLVVNQILTGHSHFSDQPLNGHQPGALSEVIAHATARDPQQRYPDAPALVAAFKAAVLGSSTHQAPMIEARNPYKGLQSFQEADARDFFGREALVTKLVSRLASGVPRFLAVVGPSGSGKSSLVHAGLVPALRAGAIPGSDSWFVVEMHPGAHPLEEMEAALLRVAIIRPPSLMEHLDAGPDGLLDAVRLALPAEAEVLIVVDQFEELFTLTSDEQARRAFLNLLGGAITQPTSRVSVVVTLRADFYDRPLLYRTFGGLLASCTEAVPPLTIGELERAISGPAESVDLSVEPGLVAQVVTEVADQPGGLPLMQYALTELFEHREGSRLTRRAFQEVGGGLGALGRRAEDLFKRLDHRGKEVARHLFLRLVTIGVEGGAETRRRVLRSELSALDLDERLVARVIETYGIHRLLSFDRDPLSRGPTVEVAHEALLSEWARLKGWIESSRENLRAHGRLASAAVEWEGAGRDPSFLLRGRHLDELEDWARTSGLAMTVAERAYLEVSRRARDAEQAGEKARQNRETALERRSVARLKALVAALALAAVVASGLTAFALNQGRQAEAQARLATAHELTAAAAANVDNDPELSILLGIQAVRITRSVDGIVLPETVELLHRAILASRVIRTFRATSTAWSSRDMVASVSSDDPGTVRLTFGIDGRPYRSWQAYERSTIQDLAFSPDGSVLATAGDDGQIELWDARSGSLLHIFQRADHGLSFSADGRYLSGLWCCDQLSEAVVWEVASGRQVAVIDLHQEIGDVPANASALSPDGSRIAVAIPSISQIWRGVELYDVKTGEWLRSFPRHEQAIPRCGYPWCRPVAVAWSPDGTRLATADEENDFGIRIWDSRSGTLVQKMNDHLGAVNAIAWSADGSRLASASGDRTAKVWSVGLDGARLLLNVHSSSPMMRVAFSADGSRILTSDSTGIARIWHIGGGSGDGGEWTVLRPEGSSGEFNFSSDGHSLVGSTVGGKVGMWSGRTGEEFLSKSFPAVVAIALGPDGNLVATAGPDDTITLRNVLDGEPSKSFDGTRLQIDGGVAGLRFSPDGKLLAVVSGTSATTVIEIASGRVLLRTPPDSWRVTATSVAFSLDGSLLAIGDAQHLKVGEEQFSGSFTVWRLSNSARVRNVSMSFGAVAVALDRSGRRLAAASEDGVAQVWDLVTGKPLATTAGRGSNVRRVALSPDGSRLATGSEDGEVRLWDAVSGAGFLELPRHAGAVEALVFSPDGSQLASIGPDLIEMSLLNLDDLLRIAGQKVGGRALSTDECERYLHVASCPAS